ncbi:MAG: DUF4886 domain-containing protein [Clostridia bacterium]|nr:DUF4886 domain-containing protein [Clostridia bacterium]
MKRILALLLIVATLLPLACACTPVKLEEKFDETVTTAETETKNKITEKPAPAETETKGENAAETEPDETEGTGMKPQSPYEQSVTKILIIGNSASNDVFTLLDRVFKAQGFGGKKYTLGYLYYSGCTFTQHVDFMNNNSAVYDYYKVSSTTAKTKEPKSTMKKALKDEQWDVIFLHPRGEEDVLHSDLQLKLRRQIEAYVNKCVPTEHVFGFHLRAVCPNDPEIYGPDWPVQAPAGYRERMEQYYGFDPAVQYAKSTEAVKTHILPDSTYAYKICTASCLYYAQEILGVPQTELYRDYTHLSDFGRVLAAYSFYAQFTGEPIDEVKLDRIPAKARQKRYQALGDLVLTEEMKQIIKESANHALEHPWDPIAK